MLPFSGPPVRSLVAAQEKPDPPAEEDPVSPPTPAAAEKPIEIPEPGLKSISGGEAKKHVSYLTGRKCQGRASGLPGCDLAGEYLIKQVKAWGLEPIGEDDSFKQPFKVTILKFPGQPAPKGVQLGGSGETFNVCAVLRGSDAELSKEYIVLSAHYDHTGARSKKKIFAGADDNASGTSTLLEVAQAFVTKGVPRPRRSVLFLWVSGEERGLLGSKYFVDHPTVPLKDIICNLNIDMVGRNPKDDKHVYGNASSPDLDSAHRLAMDASKLKFIAKTGSIFRRSDQFNFYQKDIPCLFWTSGLHKDYHSVKDTANKLNSKQMGKMGKHIFATTWRLANRTARPRFVKMDAAGTAGKLGAVLNMIPPEEIPRAKLGEGEGAALVSSVLEGMPAFEAKLQQGDLIVGVDGKALPDSDAVGAVETAAENASSKIRLRVFRRGRFLKITVKFDD